MKYIQNKDLDIPCLTSSFENWWLTCCRRISRRSRTVGAWAVCSSCRKPLSLHSSVRSDWTWRSAVPLAVFWFARIHVVGWTLPWPGPVTWIAMEASLLVVSLILEKSNKFMFYQNYVNCRKVKLINLLAKYVKQPSDRYVLNHIHFKFTWIGIVLLTMNKHENQIRLIKHYQYHCTRQYSDALCFLN